MKSEALQALALFVVYQAVWFGAVASAARGWVWIGPGLVAALLTAVSLRLERAARGRWVIAVALLGAAGTAADSLLAAAGLVHFRAGFLPGIAPPWITALWCLLAVALPGLGPLLARRPWLAALLGAAGGPAAYAAGGRMGAATFPEPSWPSLLALGVEWGIAFPLMLRDPALVTPGTRVTGDTR
jgi:Protein of unknown function (DUF2878)